jgi:hypothetical protein
MFSGQQQQGGRRESRRHKELPATREKPQEKPQDKKQQQQPQPSKLARAAKEPSAKEGTVVPPASGKGFKNSL